MPNKYPKLTIDPVHLMAIHARTAKPLIVRYTDEGDTSILPKLLLHALRSTPHSFKATNAEEARIILGLYMDVTDLLSDATPRQLLRAFPVEKDYDGKRYGVKDYFTTMEALETHGMDKPIGDKAFDIIQDYMNKDIRRLMVDLLVSMNRVRDFEGECSLLDEFMGIKDATPHAEKPGPSHLTLLKPKRKKVAAPAKLRYFLHKKTPKS